MQDFVIEHTTFISDSNVKYYFGAADIVVQPYHSATQSGITQMAYHFDKPMIVTNVGGLPEVIQHNKVGYVINPDVKELVDTIINFYDNRQEDFFIENIKIEKKKYSWDALLKVTELKVV